MLARVDGVPITRREFVARTLRKLGEVTLLSDVVKDELFRQEAARRGLQISPEALERSVEQEVEVLAKALGGGDLERGRSELVALYAKQGLSLEDVRSEMRAKVEARLIAAAVTLSMREDDEGTLRAWYEDNRQRHVRHIYYAFPPFPEQPDEKQLQEKAAARARALDARERILRGEADFAAVAKEESGDAFSRYRGGEIGPMNRRTAFDPRLKEAIFKLRPGEVSEPIESAAGGFHLFEVLRLVPAEPFEEIESRLRDEYRRQPPDLEEVQRAFDTLRDRAELEWLPQRAESSR